MSKPMMNFDGRMLFTARALRMFAFGLLSVVLALYLKAIGFDDGQIGLLLTATLAGDAVLSLYLTQRADRFGRRRVLRVGTALMCLAGLALAGSIHPAVVALAAIVGTLSPTGSEVGAFLSIEQAALTQIVPPQRRTTLFAWYNLTGSMATAAGALCAGVLVNQLEQSGFLALQAYRLLALVYTCLGLCLLLLFTRISPAVEVTQIARQQPAGLQRSRSMVYRLAGLFMLDAFAGGLVLQSVLAYWFTVRFEVNIALLGGIFSAANILAGFSALAAGRLAARFGLVNTMVWTHLPSNMLLMLVPLMPTLPLAVVVLLIRYSISQMDVPTRQSYVMAVVDPAERSAAAGVTTLARTAAVAISPSLTGLFFSIGWLNAPFFVAGALKIIYDLSLYRSFVALKPPEER